MVKKVVKIDLLCEDSYKSSSICVSERRSFDTIADYVGKKKENYIVDIGQGDLNAKKVRRN